MTYINHKVREETVRVKTGRMTLFGCRSCCLLFFWVLEGERYEIRFVLKFGKNDL